MSRSDGRYVSMLNGAMIESATTTSNNRRASARCVSPGAVCDPVMFSSRVPPSGGAPVLAQKVGEQLVAVLGQDRLGVKLNALDRQRLMAHTHDLAVLGPGGHLQAIGHALALDDERVIARGLDRI